MTTGRKLPGPLLRQLLILEELDRRDNVSQRALAGRLGLAVSLVNRQLKELLAMGYIQVVDTGVRPYAYVLTPLGRDHRHHLSHQHYRSVLGSFHEMKARIRRRLEVIRARGVRRLVFYGGGEVMEVTYPLAKALGLEVIGVVDDDPRKCEVRPGAISVEAPSAISELDPDAVLITTFRHTREIQSRIADEDPTSSIEVIEL